MTDRVKLGETPFMRLLRDPEAEDNQCKLWPLQDAGFLSQEDIDKRTAWGDALLHAAELWDALPKPYRYVDEVDSGDGIVEWDGVTLSWRLRMGSGEMYMGLGTSGRRYACELDGEIDAALAHGLALVAAALEAKRRCK